MSDGHVYQLDDTALIWDKIAQSYKTTDILGADYRAYLKVILECVGDPHGKTFCEVGCGSAMTSALLAKRGALITLVDNSSKSLGFAKNHFEELGLNAAFCQQDALKMKFDDESFDVVWNGGVVEHFFDEGKIKLISEMWRIVKPGGILLFKVPNKFDFPFMAYKIWAEWRRTWPYGFEDDLTINRCKELAKHAGINNFKVFAYNPIVGWWFVRYGKRMTEMLGLNTLEWHSKKSLFGHVICLYAQK